MPQAPSTPNTRYQAVKRPTLADGYPQRIEIWDAVERIGPANRHEAFDELVRSGHRRPNGARMDVDYVRIELTDMCRRGFLRRVEG